MSLLGYLLVLTAALYCTAAPTTEASCPRPPRKDEEELQGDWEKDSYAANTVASYLCRPGYSRQGSIRMICKDGKWENLGLRGQCRKKSCGNPGDVAFGSFKFIEGDSFVFGAIIEYFCEDGYQMVSRERRRQCTADGWSNYLPECEVRNCPPVEVAVNVNMLSTSYDEEYSVGQVVRFECKNPNQRLDGASEIFCTSDGDWNVSPPTCVEISCKLPFISNGKVNHPKKPLYQNNDVIQITCDEGFRPSTNRDIKCTKDDWIPAPSCDEITCNPYLSVENGELVAEKSVYRYDEEIDVKCNDGYVLQMEPNKRRKCTINGWSPSTRCVSKKCDRPDIKHGSLYNYYYFPIDVGRYIDYQCDTNYLSDLRKWWGRITCTKLGWDPEPKCSRECPYRKAYFPNADLKNLQSTYVEGEKVTFQCKYDYKTSDGKRDGERACLPNGEFTPAKCSKTCPAPQLQNGKLLPNKNIFEIGESLPYECNMGFMTKDRKLTSRTSCGNDGWSEIPNCELITCIYDGVSYNNGEVVKYKCPPGQKPESESGQCYYYGWGPPPYCQAAECTIPATSGLILSPHKKSYQIYEKVSFSCDSDLEIDGAKSSTCTNKDWNPPLPTCKTIQCTIPDTSGLKLSPDKKSYQIYDSVSFSCDADLEKDSSTCTKEGWNPPLPTCKRPHVEQTEATDKPSNDNKKSGSTCSIAENLNLIRKPFKQTYKENDEVVLSCEVDFIMKGPSITTCTQNGWNPTLPVCEGENAAPDSVTVPKVSENNTVVTAVILPTESINKTVENAAPDSVTLPKVSEDNPKKGEKCPLAYNPINAEIIDPKEEYYNDDNVTMKCVKGYKMKGFATIQCINGKWEQPPECIQLTPCRYPPSISNGDITESSIQETYTTDDVVTYSCKPGFHLSGPDRTTCVNGKWTTLPECIENSCDEPPEVTHGSVEQAKKTFDHGERAQYKCKKGFRISGEDSATCVNGDWMNIPTCISTSCTSPTLKNFRIDGPAKDSYASGDKITIVCNFGYSLEGSNRGEALCEDTNWKNLPECRRIGAQCGPPPTVQYGDTISFTKPSYRSGESVKYKCPEYYILKGKEIVRCLNGVWDEAPVCLEPCTAKENDMRENNIRLKWRGNKKLYSVHGDTMEFNCISEYEAPSGTNMRTECKEGKLEYPKCFRRGFCVLDQSTLIANNIHYNVSTIVDHGQRITFQCTEEMILQTALEATCESGKINYPKCIPAKSCKAPQVQNGLIKGARQESYDSGSYVEIECSEGYAISNPINIKCDNGQWTDLPVCYSPCKISTEDLEKSNIHLLPSDDTKNILGKSHKHGAQIRVTCKSGYRRPNQAGLVIECSDGRFRYPRCFSGETCRINQESLDKNNLELDEVHDNDVFYGEGEQVYYKCKNGFARQTKQDRLTTSTATCSKSKLSYPRCTDFLLTCQITQDALNTNNIELDDEQDNELLYGEGEKVKYKCKNGFSSQRVTATCKNTRLNIPKCTAQSSG